MNAANMKESIRDKIVKDLLQRKPKGSKGQNPTYEDIEYFCYDASKHKKRVQSSHRGWGYTDSDLWDLGFRNESDVRGYIFNKFYKSEENVHEYYLTSGQRAGVTRKTNRIFNRIQGAIQRVRGAGKIPGLYEVSIGYGNRFYFFGDSADEVKSLSSLMLGPIYPDENFNISFIDRALPGDILDKNIPSFERIEKDILQKRERAATLIESARKLESQAEYVKTLITQNLEVAMRAN